MSDDVMLPTDSARPDVRDSAMDGGALPPDVPFFTPDGRGVTFEYVAYLRDLLGLREGQSLVAALRRLHVSPDDQQNGGVGVASTVLPSGIGEGATSAGGESGLPLHAGGLWVDDSKPCPPGCAVARTYNDALRMLRSYDYAVLYLDHDLGGSLTGYDLLVQLFEEGRVPPRVECISWNPVGRERINAALADYAGRGADGGLSSHTHATSNDTGS